MKIKLTLFIVTFLLIQNVSLNAQNLVVNGSFEEIGSNGKPTQWDTEGSNVTWSTSSEVSDIPDGAKALKVDVTNTGSSARDISQVTLSGVVPGKEYLFSFKYNVYRAPSSADGNLIYGIAWFDANDATISAGSYESDPLPGGLNTWKTGGGYFVAPAEAVKAYIYFTFSRNIGVYVDDVQLVAESDVPTGLSAVKAQSLFVRSENGNLVVSGVPAGSRIDVYSVVGSRLQSAVAAQGETVLSGLPKGQILIVRNGNEAAKVLTK
jgi:hypothetical protein